ncbi:cytochrome P450 716B1 [Striga asiatica]|uniref:Cytochrome P450 716B1 n=1 Tax=Striga asiatica TaxID=4170 RepID=A0A5A7Q1T5_STRAF|nr:cytochrome P450 716B1 [Striga asiatica]
MKASIARAVGNLLCLGLTRPNNWATSKKSCPSGFDERREKGERGDSYLFVPSVSGPRIIEKSYGNEPRLKSSRARSSTAPRTSQTPSRPSAQALRVQQPQTKAQWHFWRNFRSIDHLTRAMTTLSLVNKIIWSSKIMLDYSFR